MMRFRSVASRSSARSFSTKPSLTWLDLRGSGLSILERLCLEECLWKHDQEHRNWLLIGTHEAQPHRYLEITPPTTATTTKDWNRSTAIVLGIGGKPHELLQTDRVQSEGCLTLRRFSGGGTVVLDADSLWTTVIGRPSLGVQAFPRPIMEWTAEQLYGPAFEKLGELQGQLGGGTQRRSQKTLILDTKSCGAVENAGRVLTLPTTTDEPTSPPPAFRLRENDYVLGDRKMGGNAQSIGSTGWLHHTSFLWDYQPENMAYLKLPSKRPKYRQDRSHEDFLVKLCEVYPQLTRRDFVASLRSVCEETFVLDVSVSLKEAQQVIEAQGGWQEWYQGHRKSRNRVVHEI